MPIIYRLPQGPTHFGHTATVFNVTFPLKQKGRSLEPPNLCPFWFSGVALNFDFITDPRGKFFHIEIKMGGIGFVLF